jgi:hypothetical protein
VVLWVEDVQFRYRRYDLARKGFLDEAPVEVKTGADNEEPVIHAAADRDGTVWVACRSTNRAPQSILSLSKLTAQNATEAVGDLDSTMEDTITSPHVVVDGQNRVWVFWHAADRKPDVNKTRIRYVVRRPNQKLDPPRSLPGTEEGRHFTPVVVAGEERGAPLWAFWNSERDAALLYSSVNAVTQLGGVPQGNASFGATPSNHFAVRGKGGTVWLLQETFVPTNLGAKRRILLRKVFTSI